MIAVQIPTPSPSTQRLSTEPVETFQVGADPTAELNLNEKVNILIVDDVPGKLVAHEAVLAELGHTVVKAGSGREALEVLLKRDFAVILLDVNMPEMNGFETAAMIRQ